MALKFGRLTREGVRKLEPGQRINEHGIIAERMMNGDLRWSIGIMSNGQRIHRVIGRDSERVTRQQAEDAIAALRTAARDDRLNLPKGRKVHRSVSQAAEEYLKRMEEGGGKNLKNKRRHLNEHLVPFLGNERLDKLTEFRLRQFRKHRAGQGAKPATINRELATLSHLLNKAASTGQDGWRWIKPDEKPGIPRDEEKRKRIDILTPEQDDALLTAATADQDPDIWLFVLMATNAPMRHSEIVCRRFDEIDWQSCRINIPDAKAGAREQPITVALRDALKGVRDQREDQDGWIFPSRTKTAKTPHRLSMAKQFRRVVKNAKLDEKKVTPHVLRHTGISRVLMAGADLKTAQTISGHKTVAMLLHYAHVLAPHVDKAMSVLNRALPGTVTQELHTDENSAPEAAPKVVQISGEKSAA